MSLNQNKEGFFKKFFSNLRYKYKLVVMNESTLEERFNFRLSRLNVLFVFAVTTILSITLTIIIIAVTPLKDYIPGYASVDKIKQVYINNARLDSLSNLIDMQERYIKNIKETILLGIDPQEEDSAIITQNKSTDYNNIPLKYSKDDSLLRLEWEEYEQSGLLYTPQSQQPKGIESFIFFKPINGTVSSGFNSRKKHFGIDLLGERDAAVKSCLDGLIILSTWTSSTGYIVAIQHNSNIISVYKHNSALLKNEGDYVKAGDPIAIIGNSGEESSGPHLHFELWYDLRPINPASVISF